MTLQVQLINKTKIEILKIVPYKRAIFKIDYIDLSDNAEQSMLVDMDGHNADQRKGFGFDRYNMTIIEDYYK